MAHRQIVGEENQIFYPNNFDWVVYNGMANW